MSVAENLHASAAAEASILIDGARYDLPIPKIPICGIGASAGGVEALQQFFRTVTNAIARH